MNSNIKYIYKTLLGEWHSCWYTTFYIEGGVITHYTSDRKEIAEIELKKLKGIQ